MKLIILCIAVLAVSCGASKLPGKDSKVRYDNHAVFKIRPENDKQRAIIRKLSTMQDHFDIWFKSEREMHVMVSPKFLNYFHNLTRFESIRSKLWLPNVQSLIDAEQPKVTKVADASDFDWTRYHSLEEIEAFMDDILAKYPQVTEEFIVGKTYEGRNIRGIKISYKSGNPGVFIESNIHAREWITSATATWFIKELLTSTNTSIRALAEEQDWYIVPILNVDGFKFSHEVNRLWRKNRKPSDTSECFGVDLNRNFDIHWMEGGDASDDPCSSSYAGTRAFSEVEVQALSQYLTSIKNKLNMLISFHSYGGVVLSPYGHSSEEVPPNFADLKAVGKAFVDAVANLPNSTNYKYGSMAGLLYTATGMTTDWVYDKLDIKLAFTAEQRDKGQFGFVLPPVQILPNCQEVMEGILAMVAKAREIKYFQVKY